MIKNGSKLFCFLEFWDSGKGVWESRLRRSAGAEFPKISDMSCCEGLGLCAEGGAKPMKCFEKGNTSKFMF